MIKLLKSEEEKIKCLTGRCSHTYRSDTCLWNKITNARDPDLEMEKEIKKLINEVVKREVNNIKIPTRKCATISKKKGK